MAVNPQHRLRKLLFSVQYRSRAVLLEPASATLTRNPSKLAPLRLREPMYFSGRDVRYQTPKELQEFMVPCDRYAGRANRATGVRY
eukprot:2656122-Rhodomonas_salina.2